VTIHTTRSSLRRASRAAVVTLGLTLGTVAAPAFADAPSTWENPNNKPAIDTLIYLLGVPILVLIVVWVLVYLPSMMRRQSSSPAVAFQERSEWFGGPRAGVDAATDEPSNGTNGKGGAGAGW
jgi:hypothetical protein